MRVITTVTVLVGVFLGCEAAATPLKSPIPSPRLRRDGQPRSPRYVVNRDRADAVKQAFEISWDGYYKYAFPHDSLRPVKNRFYDDR